ncbi:MAG: GNAT family N-acetyltransferase [Candidatus Obscuribacterales bacterium]|nr:GNAT family N-acetyltransferase [Candidatus Obscuribacterales bacterium]
MVAIRLATKEDACQVLEIYAPYCTDSYISLKNKPPTLEEMEERIAGSTNHPFLVASDRQSITGYAYAGAHRQREAYRFSVETSIYIRDTYRKTGIGRILYQKLFDILKKQGYCNAYAGIALPNPASESFHESLEFTYIGTYQNIGFKLGAWHSVGWWQLRLRHDQRPQEIMSLVEAIEQMP